MNIKKKVLSTLLAVSMVIPSASAFSVSAVWEKADGNIKYTDKSGNYVTGWQTINGGKYYFKKDGTAAIGWLKIGDKKYYFDKDGKMATGTVVINLKQYTFNKSGEWNGKQPISVTEFDFRNSHWGDTHKEVADSEENCDLEYYEGNMCVLDRTTTIGSYSYFILYDFADYGDGKELMSGYYLMDISDEPDNDDVYKEYKNLVYTYTKKYGEPIQTNENWKDKYYKEAYSNNMAKALEYGYVNVSAVFETSTTKIMVCITSTDYQLGTGIIYSDKNKKLSDNKVLDGNI